MSSKRRAALFLALCLGLAASLYAIPRSFAGMTAQIGLLILDNRLAAFKVPARSMEPGIVPGDHILVDRGHYRSHRPVRGEVVVFRLPDQPGVTAVKRVAAVGGDTVAVDAKKLIVNGAEVHENYVRWLEGGVKDFPSTAVPQNKLFLLGDNRDWSKDSRYWPDPFIDQSQLLGKVL